MAKQLSVNPAEASSTLIKVESSKLGQNPYRDMVMFPIDKVTKVPSLVESIEQTGFWPSIIARPANNEIDGKVLDRAGLEALIASGYDFGGVVWEKAFGHHRHAACEELGFDTIPIIPQIVSDENMLLMMANENKEGFGSNINSQLETVRQVRTRLEESIQDYDDYDAYKEDGGDFFPSAKSFRQAQKQGIGFKTINRFLGKTWSERDVRGPVVVLKAIDDGFFDQEDIVGVPTIGLLQGIASVSRVLFEGYTPQEKGAEAVPAVDWPMYFKNEAMLDIINRCRVNSDEGKHEITVTVAQLDKARLALQKEGVNPASFLRAGKGKTAFDIYAATKLLVVDPDADVEKNMAEIESLSERDGFEDWEGLAELQTRLVKAVEAIASGETEEDPEVGDASLDPTEEGDVNAAISEAEGGAEGGSLNAAFGEFDEGGVLPIDTLAGTVCESCEIMSNRVVALSARSDEFKADELYVAAVTGLLTDLAKLAHDTIGRSALTDAFSAATKPEEAEEVVAADPAATEEG